jgi:hypothetical protein
MVAPDMSGSACVTQTKLCHMITTIDIDILKSRSPRNNAALVHELLRGVPGIQTTDPWFLFVSQCYSPQIAVPRKTATRLGSPSDLLTYTTT